MKLLDIQAAIGTAIILLSLPCDAKHGHSLSHLEVLGRRHAHRRLQASPRVEGIEDGLKKRSVCEFPSNAGLVAVTPGSKNAGWAMSPDQECIRDSFCPYACPSGQVMAQWNPEAKNYPDPKSMDGGLYCNLNGEISKPFPNDPYCVDGTGAMGAQNNCGEVITFCQTVLPGNEAMIIPTKVDNWAQLAVPGPSYWLSTAAHYYVNPPGTGPDEGCIWGDGTSAIGNWAAYVAGANTDSNGNTFTKIAWNPVWLDSHLSGTQPSYGLKIVCSGGGCNGTPCSIDPSVDGIGGVTSATAARGANGDNFCVVTVPKGVTANVVVFNVGDSAGGSGGKKSSATPSAEPTTKKPEPTTTPEPTTSSTTPTTSSTTTTEKPKAKTNPTITLLETNSNSTTSSATSAFSPHILFENTNVTSGVAGQSTSTGSATLTATSAPVASPTKKSDATFVSGSMFSFLVVFVAAAYIF